MEIPRIVNGELRIQVKVYLPPKPPRFSWKEAGRALGANMCTDEGSPRKRPNSGRVAVLRVSPPFALEILHQELFLTHPASEELGCALKSESSCFDARTRLS